jgi:hypothetical protein
MQAVTVGKSVTLEEASSVLRDQLPGVKVEARANEPETLRVNKNPYARAKVRVRRTGGGTTFEVHPAAIGPIGYAVSTLWYHKQVARAIEQAPQLRAS